MGLFGKPKGKRQSVYILGDDRAVDNISLPLEKGYMESVKSLEAWYQVPRWFVRLVNRRDGTQAPDDEYIQLVAERNAIPVPLGLIFGVDKETDVKALTDLKPIAREKYREEQQDIEEQANRNKWLMNGLVIASLAIVCFILVMAVIFLFQSGKLNLSAIGIG